MPQPGDDLDEPMLCPTCLTPNAAGNAMCKKCRAPLNAFAATDPVLAIHSEFNTFGKAMKGTDKPIVLIAMWMLWGPSFAAACFGIAGILYILAIGMGNDRKADAGVWLLLFLDLCLTGAFALIAGKILLSTTRNFLSRRASHSIESAGEDDPEGAGAEVEGDVGDDVYDDGEVQEEPQEGSQPEDDGPAK